MHDIAAAATGMPSGKKKTHRGRKPSGKPGADHLSNLQRAHGSGDLKAAKRHALDYAKAVHSHSEPDADDATAMPGAAAPPVAKAPPSNPPSNPRAALAKLAMSRRK